MIWIKRLLFLLLALLCVAVVVAAIYVYRTFPSLDGELRAPGLKAPVSVARDSFDVTHIKAQSARDAAYAMGYVHAQERGWQLEFNRRLMHGELSEVFGASTLDTDKLLRTLGIMQAAERQYQGLPPQAKEALQGYSDGINGFYVASSQTLPPEFHILGTRPGGNTTKAWSPQDSMGWALMMALDLGGNWGTEFARLATSKTMTTGQLWQLFPPYPGEQPASRVDFAKLYADLGVYRKPVEKTAIMGSDGATISIAGYPDEIEVSATSEVPKNSETLSLSVDINDWAANLGFDGGKGSNNWVVSGSASRSGKPLLANDPHLGLSAPAIWYFAHLEAPGSNPINAIGATLPGLPFVVLGRTANVAWTFTNTGPDVQDLYLEQINPANPNQYRLPSQGKDKAWADFKTRTEAIKVKGQADVTLVVRESRHGPVLSDVQKSHTHLLDTARYVLALRWAALDADNQTVLAGLKINQAQSLDELFSAFALHHSPTQSVVAADVQGKVGFKAAGKIPLRKPDNDILGMAPSPGWDARYDWAGWVPYDVAPQAGQAAIEAKGYLATANQRITPLGYPYFIGQDWTVPYRHDRIEQMLADTLKNGAKHDMASMQAMQADQLSAATLKLLPFLQKSVAQLSVLQAGPRAEQVRRAMQGFDGVMRADKAAPLIFASWADELTRIVVGEKIGTELFKSLYGKRDFRMTVEGALERDDKDWCGANGCAAASGAALEKALRRLDASHGEDISKWMWGRAHPALSAHKPFGNVPLLARFFDVKIATGGDTFTVNVGQYWPNDERAPFANRHAASLRTVYDLADLENSQFVYQTGQSGLVFSSRYRDMSDTWATVAYRPLQMKPASMAHLSRLLP